jgi:hypothetical protein
MSRANLSCYKVDCNGEFVYLGSDDSAQLYECESCGAALKREQVETLAEDNGAIGQLAQALLERGES